MNRSPFRVGMTIETRPLRDSESNEIVSADIWVAYR